MLGLAALGCSGEQKERTLDHATVPLVVVEDRPFVDLLFRKSGGSSRTARFLVDSGGGGFLLVEGLARDLGLEWGEAEKQEGAEFARSRTAPAPFVGDFPLELEASRVFVLVGADNVLPPAAQARAEGMLPGHVLARYHVVFDYPKGTFTIARPGVLKPEGTPLPMPVASIQGFPRTELEVEGVSYGFLLDTGASFTMVSEVLLKSWGSAHPDWQRHEGAVGEAATLGGQTLETMFVPTVQWGSHTLSGTGIVSQREGVFERYMSQMMSKPIVGSLAGNVLTQFRVELDYPNATLYLSKP